MKDIKLYKWQALNLKESVFYTKKIEGNILF